MSDRRWGRVTVEGWIQEAPGEWRVVTAKTGSAGIVAVAYKIPVGASVEFLPEPVQFKDGDALRLRDGVVWSRWCLAWRQSGIANGPILDDRWARDAVSLGAVRLVPEANGV